jgi:hypothetical protein
MSRATGVDIVTGEGLAEALTGVQCIIDAASGQSPDEADATAFFTAAARNLHAAGAAAGVQRIVMVSIIGIDRLTAGYSAAKVAHERAMLAGPIPTRVLRASQFHEFVPQLMAWGTQGDVVHLPKLPTQPVAARAVAEMLVDMAVGTWEPDAPTIMEIAGPHEEKIVDLATRFAAWRGEQVRIEGVSDPADPDRELTENGALLPGPNATLAGPTFEEWLSSEDAKLAGTY